MSLGDASPRELGGAPGLPSNLLSFHLRVLQDAGVVVQVPSQADRRRAYLRLRLDDPLVATVLPPVPVPSAPRVVFVCTQNSARSHLAPRRLRARLRRPCHLRGDGAGARVNPLAVAVGGRHGLDLSGRTTAHVDDVLRADDLVVAVCDNAYESWPGAAEPPPLHWSVPDPVRIGTDEAFEAALAQITVRADRLGRALDHSGGPS